MTRFEFVYESNYWIWPFCALKGVSRVFFHSAVIKKVSSDFDGFVDELPFSMKPWMDNRIKLQITGWLFTEGQFSNSTEGSLYFPALKFLACQTYLRYLSLRLISSVKVSTIFRSLPSLVESIRPAYLRRTGKVWPDFVQTSSRICTKTGHTLWSGPSLRRRRHCRHHVPR